MFSKPFSSFRVVFNFLFVLHKYIQCDYLQLVADYDFDSNVTHILDNYDVFLVPIMNLMVISMCGLM